MQTLFDGLSLVKENNLVNNYKVLSDIRQMNWKAMHIM